MPPSRVVLAGGTGLLGGALADALAATGHDVIVLTRQGSSVTVDAGHADTTHAGVRLAHWTPDGTAGPWTAFLDGAVAVLNLAGESIGEGRWTASRKRRLRESRVNATRSLVNAIASCTRPPETFIAASGIGYYGMRTDDAVITEDSPAGSDFIARLCIDWEAEARRAASHVRRVVVLRSGLVLDAQGGALPRMIMPFRFFAGGPLGSGGQYLSWIALDDWVALTGWAIAEAKVSGPLNATSPGPVTNRDFAREVGRVLGRPASLRAPAFALRLLLGEIANTLLTGQRAVPERALALGFRFRYPELGPALQSALRPQTRTG